MQEKDYLPITYSFVSYEENFSSRRELLNLRRELSNPRRELSNPRRGLKNCIHDLHIYPVSIRRMDPQQ